MEEPSRIEKMVGELLGLRLIVSQLLEAEAARHPDAESLQRVRGAALAAIETWPIGSDTPEGAERIRRCARGMLTEFPGPTKIA
jgi:hypothetical protein